MMKEEYLWEIKAKNTPLLKRKCNHCNNHRFYCSNKFRINAQKKNIDIWLIYKCTKCDNTYNLTILSHTKPDAIPKDLFHKFSANDKQLAWRYAFSAGICKNNNIEMDYNSVEYEIINEPFLLDTISNLADGTIAVQLKIDFHFELKLSSVVRKCLCLSANQFKRMIETKDILMPQGASVKKHKVKNGDVIWITRNGLQMLMDLA